MGILFFDILSTGAEICASGEMQLFSQESNKCSGLTQHNKYDKSSQRGIGIVVVQKMQLVTNG